MDYTELVSMAKENPNLSTELWQSIKRLAYKVASKYEGVYGAEMEDLMQEAFISMLTAIENYDKEAGEFTTLYAFILKRDLSRYTKSLCMVPEGMTTKVWRLKEYEAKVQQAKGRKPTKAEAQRALKMTTYDMDNISKATCALNPKSLDAPFSDDGDLSIGDTVPSETCDTDRIERSIDHKTMAAHLWKAVEREGVTDLMTAVYSQGESISHYCRRTGEPDGQTRKKHDRALKNIRSSKTAEKHLFPYYQEYLPGLYKRGGMAHFKHTGMSEPEAIVIQKLMLGK